MPYEDFYIPVDVLNSHGLNGLITLIDQYVNRQQRIKRCIETIFVVNNKAPLVKYLNMNMIVDTLMLSFFNHYQSIINKKVDLIHEMSLMIDYGYERQDTYPHIVYVNAVEDYFRMTQNEYDSQMMRDIYGEYQSCEGDYKYLILALNLREDNTNEDLLSHDEDYYVNKYILALEKSYGSKS